MSLSDNLDLRRAGIPGWLHRCHFFVRNAPAQFHLLKSSLLVVSVKKRSLDTKRLNITVIVYQNSPIFRRDTCHLLRRNREIYLLFLQGPNLKAGLRQNLLPFCSGIHHLKNRFQGIIPLLPRRHRIMLPVVIIRFLLFFQNDSCRRIYFHPCIIPGRITLDVSTKKSLHAHRQGIRSFRRISLLVHTPHLEHMIVVFSFRLIGRKSDHPADLNINASLLRVILFSVINDIKEIPLRILPVNQNGRIRVLPFPSFPAIWQFHITQLFMRIFQHIWHFLTSGWQLLEVQHHFTGLHLIQRRVIRILWLHTKQGAPCLVRYYFSCLVHCRHFRIIDAPVEIFSVKALSGRHNLPQRCVRNDALRISQRILHASRLIPLLLLNCRISRSARVKSRDCKSLARRGLHGNSQEGIHLIRL